MDTTLSNSTRPAPGPASYDASQRAQAIYHRLKDAQRRFGLVRLEIGALLEQVKEEQIWKGRGNSFGGFLEEERINPSAAYSYMRISRKLLFELALSDAEFAMLACVNIGVLDLACQIIDEENKDEILGYLTALSERDAKQVMLEMIDARQPDSQPDTPRRSRQIERTLRHFRELPDDQRIEFLHTINPRLPNR